jgi:hypothetical protein
MTKGEPGEPVVLPSQCRFIGTLQKRDTSPAGLSYFFSQFKLVPAFCCLDESKPPDLLMNATYQESFMKAEIVPTLFDLFDDEDINMTKDAKVTSISIATTLLPLQYEHLRKDDIASSSFFAEMAGSKLDTLYSQDMPADKMSFGPTPIGAPFCNYFVTHEFDQRFRDGVGLPPLNKQQQSFPQQDAAKIPTSAMDLIKASASKKDTLLPTFFKPGPYSVIIGRGKECKGATGNERLKVLASTFLPRYSSALNKAAKTKIVATVVSMIREACPLGAFIRLGKDGRWYEVTEAVATEKVGYTMRELLGDRYKSSSKSKARVRRCQSGGSDEDALCSSSSSRMSESLSSS